jgi:hypothetical protein
VYIQDFFSIFKLYMLFVVSKLSHEREMNPPYVMQRLLLMCTNVMVLFFSDGD